MRRQRPILVISQPPYTSVLNAVAIAGLIAALVISIYGWHVLPNTIPVHFGFDGRPNGWGSKAIVWLFPILGLIDYIAMTWLVRYPHTFNYAVPITEQNAARQYQIACSMLNWMKTELTWLMVYIDWQIVQLATASDGGLGLWFLPIVVLIILVTTGYWMRQSWLAR
jgi:uncharacterized membrane protein